MRTGSSLTASLLPLKLTISGVRLNGSIAMDRRAADSLSKICLCVGCMTCPCCRRLRSASSVADDGCGICDECLAP
ncbi:hypothetical protein ELG68_35995 [Rhizobium leguminosarum]|nr:hypothetical protein ELG68_35995 [Rhizobium leguminosarum]